MRPTELGERDSSRVLAVSRSIDAHIIDIGADRPGAEIAEDGATSGTGGADDPARLPDAPVAIDEGG